MKPRLLSKHTARSALTGQAMADGHAHRVADNLRGELTTTARGEAIRHRLMRSLGLSHLLHVIESAAEGLSVTRLLFGFSLGRRKALSFPTRRSSDLDVCR